MLHCPKFALSLINKAHVIQTHVDLRKPRLAWSAVCTCLGPGRGRRLVGEENALVYSVQWTALVDDGE